MRVVLDLDREQLSTIMSAIEGMFPASGPRCARTLDESIERAAERWTKPEETEFLYATVKVAPAYRQLLKAWGRRGRENGTYLANDLQDFVKALRAARAGSRVTPYGKRAQTRRGAH